LGELKGVGGHKIRDSLGHGFLETSRKITRKVFSLVRCLTIWLPLIVDLG